MEANAQGTFYKTLTVERNGESSSNTILKTAFMKKSENYTCLVRKFVTNITPPLNTVNEVAVHIKMRGVENDDPDLIGFPTFWDPNDTRFAPIPYHSTIEFLRQLQKFFQYRLVHLPLRFPNVPQGS